MKKHVTLFLALLMVVSVFFTISAEAAQPEQIKSEQSQSCAIGENGQEKGSVLCISGSSAGTNAAVTPGSGGCSHSYRIAQYNVSYHKLICTKCGKTAYCTHNRSYVSTGNVHVVRCSQCGYSFGSSSHSLTVKEDSFTYHKISCLYCSFSTLERHNFDTCEPIDSANHFYRCSKCGGMSIPEDHAWGWESVLNIFKCKNCGYKKYSD